MYEFKPWIVDEKGQFKYPHTTIYRTIGTVLSYLSLMYNVMSFHVSNEHVIKSLELLI